MFGPITQVVANAVLASAMTGDAIEEPTLVFPQPDHPKVTDVNAPAITATKDLGTHSGVSFQVVELDNGSRFLNASHGQGNASVPFSTREEISGIEVVSSSELTRNSSGTHQVIKFEVTGQKDALLAIVGGNDNPALLELAVHSSPLPFEEINASPITPVALGRERPALPDGLSVESFSTNTPFGADYLLISDQRNAVLVQYPEPVSGAVAITSAEITGYRELGVLADQTLGIISFNDDAVNSPCLLICNSPDGLAVTQHNWTTNGVLPDLAKFDTPDQSAEIDQNSPTPSFRYVEFTVGEIAYALAVSSDSHGVEISLAAL
ncbi:MAG: hypothetical protein H6619_03430 [Deltaproteobacteria bacterium]|nr:hypothetical protein [Deltaproteobacteria bacterium]